MFTNALDKLSSTLTAIGESSKQARAEEFQQLLKIGQATGGLNSLPPAARKKVANEAFGSLEGLELHEDGGVLFPTSTQDQLSAVQQKYEMGLWEQANNPDPKISEPASVQLGVLNGWINKPLHPTEIAAKQARNAVDIHNARLRFIQGTNRNAVRAGPQIDRYMHTTPEGMFMFLGEAQWKLTNPGKELPPKATMRDVKEGMNINEQTIDNMKEGLDLLRLQAGGQDQKALVGVINGLIKAKKAVEGGNEWDALIAAPMLDLVEAMVKDGASPEQIAGGAEGYADGWFWENPMKKLWLDAVDRGLQARSIAPAPIVEDSTKSSLIRQGMMEQVGLMADADATRPAMIFQLTRAAQAVFPEMDYDMLTALAEGVVSEYESQVSAGVPRPE
jgi:hypothetical protein